MQTGANGRLMGGYQGGMFGCYIIPPLLDRAHLPARGGQGKRADELDMDYLTTNRRVSGVARTPVNTVAQDRYEDNLFLTSS